MKEYKEFVESTRLLTDKQKDLLDRFLTLTTEANEVLELFTKKNRYGRSFTKERLIDELGDVFYSIIAIANVYDIDLEDMIEYNKNKLKNRGNIK